MIHTLTAVKSFRALVDQLYMYKMHIERLKEKAARYEPGTQRAIADLEVALAQEKYDMLKSLVAGHTVAPS